MGAAAEGELDDAHADLGGTDQAGQGHGGGAADAQGLEQVEQLHRGGGHDHRRHREGHREEALGRQAPGFA